MSTIVDHSILEAQSFNKIRTFEDQQKSVDIDLLHGIGYIFVKNDVHNRLAAEILHRHITLEEGTVLLHEQDMAKMEICRVTPRSSLDESQVTGEFHYFADSQGCSFFLNEYNLIQPYEYQIGPISAPIDDHFAMEMREYLIQHGLQDRISIVLRSEIKTCEFMLPEQDGTIRVPIDQLDDEDLEGCEIYFLILSI